ncbi:MAG: universal stress protein [Gemmatimonadetes bacterium]|nr:universal stress protein [Gemmatimonadota bacterium]NIO31810.1 universal stress protein [Gemmatimonadota bacterium]
MTDFKRVLAATDGSEHGLNAVVTGAAWAARAGASLEVATVVEVLLLPPEYAPPGVEPAEYELAFVRDAREKAEKQAEEAGAVGVPVHVRAGLTPQLVNRIADETDSDLIVIGASPQPARGSLVGSTGRRTLYLAQRPVLLASEARREPFRRVLVAVDLSEMSGPVLEAAWALAEADGAELRVLYVLEPLPLMLAKAASIDESERLRHGREQMEAVLEGTGLLGEDSVQARMREGRAGHEILEEAQGWDADLVAVGTHGFGFFDRLLLGSTPLYVLRHGQRATLIVPRREAGD